MSTSQSSVVIDHSNQIVHLMPNIRIRHKFIQFQLSKAKPKFFNCSKKSTDCPTIGLEKSKSVIFRKSSFIASDIFIRGILDCRYHIFV